MNTTQHKLVKEHISEINEYKEVLIRLFKQPVTLDQAIADWFEKGFHKKYSKEKTSL